MKLARIWVLIVAAGAALVPPATASVRTPAMLPVSVPLTFVGDRPEIRSYQPYGTLQFNFRPDPPIFRGERSPRPQVRMPRPRQPLIEYGLQPYDAARWYTYCADRLDRGIEPRDGPYGPQPVERRCRN